MKIKIRSYQDGGSVIASVYQPVVTTPTSSANKYAISLLYGSTPQSNGTSSSDKGSITEKDLYAGLYKTIAEQGLQSDTQAIISKLQTDLFNQNLLDPFGSTSNLSAQYLQALNYVNQAKSSQQLYNSAYNQAVANNSLQEAAITPDGNVAVKNANGEISFISPEAYKKNAENYTLLTNGNLLAERMHNYAFQDNLLEIVQGGTSIKDIQNTIQSFISKLGTSTNELTGYTSVQQDQIRKGISLLSAAAQKYGPKAVQDMFAAEGLYKTEFSNTSSSNQINAAIKAIYDSLSPAQEALLKVKSDGTNQGVLNYIANIVSIGASDSTKFSLDIESGVDANGNKVGKSSSSGGDKEVQLNDAEVLLYGMNEPEAITYGYGNAAFTSMGRRSQITTYQGESMGADFSYSQVYQSQIGKILDFDSASFGDMPINKALKDRIIVDNSTVYGVDLPYTTTEDGRIIPDFTLLSKIREVDNTILQQGLSPQKPSDITKINKLYTDAGLPVKYALDGSGNIILTGKYKRFAAFQATTDEVALLGKLSLSDGTFEIVDDDTEIDRYKEAMKKVTGQKDYSLDKKYWFTGDRHIVKGTIFIPITGSAVDARTASSSSKLTGGISDYSTLREAWSAKRNYNPAASTINITQ